MLEQNRRDPFKINGVAVGIVVDNKHPEGLYRIKVKFPWVGETDSRYTAKPDDEDFLSTWCRITTFMSGKDRGAFWLPEVDDEVLVAFEQGDVRRPYVIGSLWNGVDTAIHSNEEQGGKNWFRSIRSRSGHMLQFVDDKEGTERVVLQNLVQPQDEEKDPRQRDGHWIALDQSGDVDQIEIYDHTQEHYVLIDTKNKKITIECVTGDMDIFVEKTIHMKCTDLKIEASNNIEAKADSNVKIEAGSNMDLKAGGTMTEKASTIKLN